MALTEKEKDLIREIICNQAGQQPDGKGGFRTIRKRVTPGTLRDFAEKTDDEARAEITLYLCQKKKALETQRKTVLAQKEKIEAELLAFDAKEQA